MSGGKEEQDMRTYICDGRRLQADSPLRMRAAWS
jgi:hypothetical protein